MDKDAAIRIITACAKLYDDNLKNKNLLFFFDDGWNGVAYIETLFLRRNYLHLTGVIQSGTRMRATDFYDISLRGQLSPSHFDLHKDGSSDLKLSVLSTIMSIHKTAKMVGDYNMTKSLLITEKIVGTVTACLGFVRENDYYLPNTVLREDIRDVTRSPQRRILATSLKKSNDTVYSEISYLAKDFTIGSLVLPDEIKKKVKIQETAKP